MPLFEPFSHYLAYGATDQQTFRELRSDYTGLLVPGTIAAWQRQGTGGFVLSLSATQEAPPYVIDPRFPLFQQGLRDPKQSHLALAELFGDPSLIRETDASPGDFPDERLEQLAASWVQFNLTYGDTASEKFAKYAERLGEPSLSPQSAQAPEAVLAPYFAVKDAGDPWWERSKALINAARAACAQLPCVSVVCVQESSGLASVLEDLDQSEIAVWVSGLDEHNAQVRDLVSYRDAIRAAAARSQSLFGLYGGFYSVLLGVSGLAGCAHGVGFERAPGLAGAAGIRSPTSTLLPSTVSPIHRSRPGSTAMDDRSVANRVSM